MLWLAAAPLRAFTGQKRQVEFTQGTEDALEVPHKKRYSPARKEGCGAGMLDLITKNKEVKQINQRLRGCAKVILTEVPNQL